MLQAVAVMLMVWHHLFGFPERISVPSVLVLDRFYSVETFLAYFGRICVAVFAFVSGYGMRKKMVGAKQSHGIIKNYGTVVALFVFTEKIPGYRFLAVLICFVLGMYFVDSPIFEWLEKCFCKAALLKILLGLLGIGVVFVLRFKGLPDYILVAPFVFSVVLILKTKLVTKCLSPLLGFVGKYSTYVWLTHTFFGYYLFQKITFAPKYSWLVFLWCMLLSLGTGMVLEKLRTLIGKGFKR